MGCTRPGGVGGNLGWGNGERARHGASKSIEWSALQMGDKECARGACPLAFSTAGIHGVDAGMSACPVVSASPGMGAAEAGVSPGECSGKDTSSPSRKAESALTSSGVGEGESPSGGMVCVTWSRYIHRCGVRWRTHHVRNHLMASHAYRLSNV